MLDAVKVTECHITSLKSIEVVGHETAITYNLWLLSKMNERSILRTGSYKTFVNDRCAQIFRNRLMRSPREPRSVASRNYYYFCRSVYQPL